MGVERSHEDEGNIHLVGGVQMLDLADGQIEEGHVVLDLQSTFGAGHAYSSPTKSAKKTEGRDEITNPWRYQALR